MLPFALQLVKTALLGVAAVGFAYYVYRIQQSSENESCGVPSRTFRHGEGSTRPALRKSIADKLNSGTYECNVCLENISRNHATVSCKKCFTIFHLKCIERYIQICRGNFTTPNCPTCRASIDYALEYYCFCGALKNPPPRLGGIPHSCPSRCRYCRLSCHPGPCSDH